jgi:hypothetical protein
MMPEGRTDAGHGAWPIHELREMIARRVGEERVPRRIRFVEDTSDFFRVDYDDVLVLEGRPYFIRHYEREGRFGIDEQPKFWVRRAIDLTDGKTRILKMDFRERFTAHVGDMAFECVRSPEKEARVLGLVAGHPNFMQGHTARDPAGNPVRVIEYIRGGRLDDLVLSMGETHEEYFFLHFPPVLERFITLVRAIGLLHRGGEKHGDIRRDHIIADRETGTDRWIDFDFNYFHQESFAGYDLFGLGNVLVYLAARGDVTVQMLRSRHPEVCGRLRDGDMNIIFHNRLVNLKKLYPYVPDELNTVLRHFGAGAEVFYDDIGQFIEDLGEAVDTMKTRAG